jgi:hypothetical protein
MTEPPRRPPAIWLGDVVRVSMALGITVDAAARTLGLVAPVTLTAPRNTNPDSVRTPRLPTAHLPAPAQAAPTVRDTVRARPPDAPEPGAAAPLIERIPPDAARSGIAPRALPEVADVLTSPPRGPTGGDSADLLPPGRHRAILAALCRSTGPGEIDVDAAVDRISRREPLHRLPVTAVPTTRRGVQVLVDYGDGMRPFLRDQRDVVRALERLAGPDGLEVLRFAGTPLDEPGTGPGPAWTWGPYRPPMNGQPIVVLSDLGAGAGHPDRRAVQQRWLGLATRWRAGGHQVVALVPVPPSRLPDRLRAALPVLMWDRSARVADAVRLAVRPLRSPT